MSDFVTELPESTLFEPAIYDPWTPLDYKRVTIRRSGVSSQLAKDWIGDEHRRRLTSYNTLRAYLANAARRLMDDHKRGAQHREYGDAFVIREQVRGALLGDEQTISVPGADDDADENHAAALVMQEWFEQWADDERLPLKMIETEGHAVGLGDGVYTLGWSSKKGRPRLRCWDPCFYFPVLSPTASEDDFPTRVHLAWEVPAKPGETVIRIRRITWELVTLDAPVTYAYQDQPSTATCYMTDATFTLDNGRPQSVDDFNTLNATYELNDDGEEINRLDLQIDFIPVVHVPNTIALLDHYGQSTISTILQILDDLAAADTDLQAASATTGSPVVAVAGASFGADKISYTPGQLIEMPDNGRMDVMDTSASLVALLSYVEALLKRLSVNARTPEALLGRVNPSDVPSGIALRLGFGPLERMVNDMRLVRQEKYPLLLKFVWRLAVAGQAEDVPPAFLPVELVFGSFLPADTEAAVQSVATMRGAGTISLESAVAMQREAGVPVEDVDEEIELIESRDFEGANALLDATGSEQAVADYTGRDVAVAPVTPEPPTGGGDGGV